MLYTKPLTNNRDFCRMYAKAASAVSPLMVSYVMKNRLGYNRLGITASKKVGNAVCRNRARRIIKAAYAMTEQKLLQGYDIVLVARGRTVSAKTQQLLPVLNAHAKKLNIFAAGKN
ncbi:MAG: ribonuclease P protein component [Hydrogenoanaerobacterium sp.]